MDKYKNVIVICVDRDNDLGKKANIQGPIIGRKENLNAAAKLAIVDPTDSDINSIFAAVKKYDEVKKQFSNIEVVTLTGAGKIGFECDRRIIEQLDSVLERFPADAFILVTDGAEDEQVMPILQGRAPIISKETVIVKQAAEVESTYYTIKEALKDPAIARIVFLIPGIIVILWGIVFFLGLEKFFYQIMSLIVGTYLILKGTGLEEKIVSTVVSVTKPISLQRVSFPFYLMTILIFLMGFYSSYLAYVSPANVSFIDKASATAEQIINFATISALSFVVGRSIDSIQLRKAFYLRKYFLSATAILILWFVLDSGRRVVIGEPYAGIEWFSFNIFISFIVAVIAYRISSVLDVRKKITKLLIGLPVYNREGRWIGKVESIQKNNRAIQYKDIKTKQNIQISGGKFVLRDGRILLTG